LDRAHIKERLRDFTLTHFALWRGLVVWNDMRRYPDLPPDSKVKPLYPPNQRNITNEFQIRYLSSAHEAYLVLALWNLLYDESRGKQNNRQPTSGGGQSFTVKISLLSPQFAEISSLKTLVSRKAPWRLLRSVAVSAVGGQLLMLHSLILRMA
jgi:hypothetical protein